MSPDGLRVPPPSARIPADGGLIDFPGPETFFPADDIPILAHKSLPDVPVQKFATKDSLITHSTPIIPSSRVACPTRKASVPDHFRVYSSSENENDSDTDASSDTKYTPPAFSTIDDSSSDSSSQPDLSCEGTSYRVSKSSSPSSVGISALAPKGPSQAPPPNSTRKTSDSESSTLGKAISNPPISKGPVPVTNQSITQSKVTTTASFASRFATLRNTVQKRDEISKPQNGSTIRSHSKERFVSKRRSLKDIQPLEWRIAKLPLSEASTPAKGNTSKTS